MRAAAIAAFVGGMSAGCGLITGVEWDRVQVRASGLGDGGIQGPDGAAVGPGASGDAGCAAPKVECLTNEGCCAPQPDLGKPIAIAAGGETTCAVTSTGLVRCWGANGVGQLGRGQLPSSNKPVTALRILGGASSVTVGTSHACAVVENTVACWGSNATGELGVASMISSDVPVKITALRGTFGAISAGTSYTCATVDGAAYCWGANSAFQIGQEVDLQTSVPVGVEKLGVQVDVVATSREHTCAVADGRAKCWGNNTQNRLGIPGAAQTGTPGPVAATMGATALALGATHTCAIVGGAAKCWGSNAFGELGNDSVQLTTVMPTIATGLHSGVTSIAAGYAHTCVVVDGAAKCFGGNTKGELGNDTSQPSRVPAQVVGLEAGVKQVACGQFHSCALLVSGSIKCWGRNDNGELGNSSSTPPSSKTPVDVTWP